MFYLYHDFGCCNYGDHSVGIDEYATLQEALAAHDEMRSHNYCGDDDFMIIEGKEVNPTHG
jgi:hypothetical protein